MTEKLLHYSCNLSKIVGDKVKCLLCPHACSLEENQVGKCRVRKNNGEDIELTNYGEVSAMAVQPLYKAPFMHYGDKDNKSLSLSLSQKCNLSCQFCLPPDSIISTQKGPKRIDQIQDGEEIFALDNSNTDPQLVLAHVGEVFDRESEEVIVIEVGGGRLELTPEHPVMTKNRGWVEAGDLTLNDEVLCDKSRL